MTARRVGAWWRSRVLAAGIALAAVGPDAARAQDTREAEVEGARDEKAAAQTPQHRSLLERVLYAIEDDLLIERWLAPPRGFFVRLGGIGEGGGFGAGPAFRFNQPAFDVRGAAAASLKKYTIIEGAVRVPGTRGYNEYIRPDGPYVELSARHRDAPQEDFFGLGPDSAYGARSNYALRETVATFTGGLAKRNLTVGVTAGHQANSVRAGTDSRMPSSTDTFRPDDVPGLTGRPRFVTVAPFVRFQTRDRSENDHDGGEYRATWTNYHDREGAFSFDRWDVDLRQYIGFGRRTRSVALRAWASAATPRDGHEVPFYLQPWLGGAQSVRGYRTFRFRDRSALLLQGEYRWRVNELVTGALFYDTGAVAPTLGGLGRLEDSYGAGLRVGGRMGSALRLDVAFGSRDGRRILVRFDDVF